MQGGQPGPGDILVKLSGVEKFSPHMDVEHLESVSVSNFKLNAADAANDPSVDARRSECADSLCLRLDRLVAKAQKVSSAGEADHFSETWHARSFEPQNFADNVVGRIKSLRRPGITIMSKQRALWIS